MPGLAFSTLLLVAASGCRIAFDHQPAVDATTIDTSEVSCPVHPCSIPGIYRSVGPSNTSPLTQGSGNVLTITGATATFTSSLPARVGVGDVIQYDSTGDGTVDALAFVHERISSTEYLVANETGGTPTPVTVDEDWAMFRAYTTLNAAGAGTRNSSIAIAFDGWGATHDLTALGLPWHIVCYGDAADTVSVNILGWDTSATAYLRIFTPVADYEVGVSQRHAGKWDPTKYSLEPLPTSIDIGLAVGDAYTRIEGLQVFINSDNTPGDLPYGITLDDNVVPRVAYVGHNIIRSNNMATPATSIARAIKMHATVAGQTLYTYNNIVYDFAGDVRGIEATGIGTTIYSYNNTFVNLYPALLGNASADTFIVRNTVALECFDPCLSGAATYMGANNVGTVDFDTRGIGVLLTSNTITDYFVANGDFHLDPTALHADQLVDRGLDLSADPVVPFGVDIDGALRVGAWDIGADETSP